MVRRRSGDMYRLTVERSSTMERVRWGIIGVGDVTERKSGPAFYKAPHSELVAVMRRNGDKARDYRRAPRGAEVVRRRRCAHRRSRRRRGLHLDPTRHAQGIHPEGRGRRQTGVLREADGPQPRRVPRDDRGVRRRRRSALGGVLSALDAPVLEDQGAPRRKGDRRCRSRFRSGRTDAR